MGSAHSETCDTGAIEGTIIGGALRYLGAYWRISISIKVVGKGLINRD